jgi:hypothetical protein
MQVGASGCDGEIIRSRELQKKARSAPMTREVTTVEVKGETYRELKERKSEKDSFDDVISRTLKDEG